MIKQYDKMSNLLSTIKRPNSLECLEMLLVHHLTDGSIFEIEKPIRNAYSLAF